MQPVCLYQKRHNAARCTHDLARKPKEVAHARLNVRKKQGGDTKVDDKRQDIVNGCNQWTGGHSRIDLEFEQNEGMMVPAIVPTMSVAISELPTTSPR